MENCRNKLNDTQYICLFGLGVLFQDCYSQLVLSLGREPDFLCDNAPEKWGREFFGKRCLSPADLGKFGEHTAVVVTIRKYEDVYRQLREMGLRNIFVACFDRGYDVVHSIKSLGTEHCVRDDQPSGRPVQDKWTLVTGASRGIGRQIAIEMAKLGSNIVAHSRQVSHTEDLVNACQALGVRAESIAADLGNLAELEEMLQKLDDHLPPIDIVFNNAGISLPCGPDPLSVSSRDFLAHYTVNTVAPIRICYRVLPGMMQRGFGRLINISSTIQKRPGEMAYSCSKAALSKFVHDMAPSLHGTGVMMSLVCPGYVRSDMGGPDAPHPVESVIPGVLLGAVLDGDINGRWFIAQDYAGLRLPEAINKAKFYCREED